MPGPERKFTEEPINKYAVKRGWLYYKTTFLNVNGAPDGLYIRKGRHVWIESKRLGKGPTPQQALRHKEMRDHGCEVYCLDRPDEAYAILA